MDVIKNVISISSALAGRWVHVTRVRNWQIMTCNDLLNDLVS